MTDTELLNQTLALGDNSDAIRLDIQDGHAFIVIGSTSLAVDMSSPAALNKLAHVASRAAGVLAAREYADRNLKAV